MSFESMEKVLGFSMGNPSMTHSGALLPVSELPPRMVMSTPAPGPPSELVTCTPAMRPARASEKLADTTPRSRSEVLIVATAPEMSFLAIWP